MREAVSGAPCIAVVFGNSNHVAALKFQKQNDLHSHADTMKILDQVRRMRSTFLKLVEDLRANLPESLKALHDEPLVSHNSIQNISKENNVLLLVGLFD